MKIVQEIGIQEIFIPKNFIKYCGIPTTEKEIEVYKEIFDSLSSSQGVMTPKDLRLAIEKYCGYKPKRQLIYQIFGEFDKDSSGEIEFKEFL